MHQSKPFGYPVHLVPFHNWVPQRDRVPNGLGTQTVWYPAGLETGRPAQWTGPAWPGPTGVLSRAGRARSFVGPGRTGQRILPDRPARRFITLFLPFIKLDVCNMLRKILEKLYNRIAMWSSIRLCNKP